MKHVLWVRRVWVGFFATAVLFAVAGPVGTATTETYDILVRIAPDSPTGPVRTQNGYTISIINTTTQDLAFDQIRFLLPGHGGNPVPEDIYGEPRQSNDHTPAFDYVQGSTSGLTTSDPALVERWLTWGAGIVGAGTTVSLHFNVTLSNAPAYYWSGASIDAPGATVQGTAKGGQIQVISSSLFALTVEAPDEVPLGGTIPYTGTLINNTDQTLTVKSYNARGVRHGRYIPGSTTGVLTGDPVEKGNGYIWYQFITIPPHSQVQFGFDVSADVPGVHGIQNRAFLTEPLPDGQVFAGTGPTAKVHVKP